jgi:Bacterial Ig-like domain (group 2)
MEPLNPAEAAALFNAGEPLAFIVSPAEPFVRGRWMGEPCVCIPLPQTESLEQYFTDNPVILASSYRPPLPGKAAKATIQVNGAGWSVKGTKMEVTLPLGLWVDLTVAYVDANGNPAAPPGPVAWSSSDPTIASINPNTGNQLVATVQPVKEGSVTITAASGSITATIAITVAAGVAVSATITAGTPYTPPAPAASS